MKKMLLANLALAGVVAFAAPAQAHGFLRGGCGDCGQPCAQPCPPPPPKYIEKTVTCYRLEWREKEVELTVNRRIPHEEVRKHTFTACVPVWSEEKRTITEYKRVAKEVEREVVVCKKVPCEAPCGDCDDGCGRHHRLFGHRHADCGCGPSYTTVQEVKKVKCTVYECVPVPRELTVKVCHYRQEQRTVELKHTVWECKPEKVKQKVRYCERVPYQMTIKVPVCEKGCGCGGHRLFHRHSGGDGCCG